MIWLGDPGEAELLGIVCRGGQHYQCRVGRTYTDVPVERTEGWHLFAWECDGCRTVAHIDGVEVFCKLRSGPETSEIPICIVTGHPEFRQLIYDRPERPPEGYMNKPVDPDELVRTVRRILGLQRRRQERTSRA